MIKGLLLLVGLWYLPEFVTLIKREYFNHHIERIERQLAACQTETTSNEGAIGFKFTDPTCTAMVHSKNEYLDRLHITTEWMEEQNWRKRLVQFYKVILS